MQVGEIFHRADVQGALEQSDEIRGIEFHIVGELLEGKMFEDMRLHETQRFLDRDVFLCSAEFGGSSFQSVE